MKKIEQFIAEDGTKFDNEAECKAHEASIAELDTVTAYLDQAGPADEKTKKPTALDGRSRSQARNTILAFLKFRAESTEKQSKAA